MTKFASSLLVCAILATPLAAQAPSDTSPAATSTQNDGDKIMCRAREQQTGSMLMAKKVCHTKREWAAAEQQAKDDLDRFQRSRMTNTR